MKNGVKIRKYDVQKFNQKMMKMSMFAANSKGVDIGFNADYAAYVEYGTSKMKAQPYFEPAINNRLILFRKKLKATGFKLLKGQNTQNAAHIMKSLGLSILENTADRVPVDSGTLRQSMYIKPA